MVRGKIYPQQDFTKRQYFKMEPKYMNKNLNETIDRS